MYNRFAEDEDHIAWLKQFKVERETLIMKNKQIKVNLNDFGLDDLVGL